MNHRMTIQTVPAHRNLIVVQRNPTSGSGRGRREAWKLFQNLRSKGFEVRVYHCRSRFNHFVQRADVADRLRCLVAAGGDGTISSLVQRHPQYPIAVLPLGTENLVAKHLGIRSDGDELATVIQSGCYLPFDTGLVGSYRFLLMASAGMDAEVVRLLAESRTGNISHLTYLKPLLHAFLKYTYPELQVLDESGKLLAVGTHVLVANMAEYGMKIPFCPDASPHDGLLDVRVFRKSGPLRTALHLLKTKFGGRDSTNSVARFQAARLSVTCSDTDVPLQADGDPCGTGGTEFRVAEEKMHLMVPSHFHPKQPGC